jgi:hypothetical protein
MIWALLAAFLRNRPPWAQAAMLGLCTGLFVAAATVGVQRITDLGWSTLLVLVVGVSAGGPFYIVLLAHVRSRSTARERAIPIHVAHAAVWLVLVGMAVRALLVAGGPRVAVFAIVPIVLLAPPALVGLRVLTGRPAERRVGTHRRRPFLPGIRRRRRTLRGS